MTHFGFDDTGWTPDMRAAIEIIAACAESGETITYGELADQVGGYTAQSIGERLLNQILSSTRAKAGCLITSVVVRKYRPRRSGDGFMETAASLGYDTSEPTDFWQRQLEMTYRYFMSIAGPVD